MISNQQQTLSDSSSKTNHPPTEKNSKDPQPFNSDEEEEEDYNIVLYNLPDKKTDPKKEKLLQEKLKERNQQIQEKKQQAKNQIHPLIFTESHSMVSFEKTTKLPDQPKTACFIPEKDLFLVLLTDWVTVKVYSAKNFDLILTKKSKSAVTSMSYSKKLDMILLIGTGNLLQLWNSKTFEVEAESLKEDFQHYFNIIHDQKSNVIVATTECPISIFNSGLKHIQDFYLPIYFGQNKKTDAAETQGISKHQILVICRYEQNKTPHLINLKTKTMKEVDLKGIFIPSSSCVKLTENNPSNIFTCLVDFENEPSKTYEEWSSFKLAQFTIDPKNEEFSIVRNTITSHSFSKLSYLENSKGLFLAQRKDSGKGCETFLLSIKKDHVEVLKEISMGYMALNRLSKLFMVKEGSTIVQVNQNNSVFVYEMTVQKEKNEEFEKDS